jgi:hypothetical protein
MNETTMKYSLGNVSDDLAVVIIAINTLDSFVITLLNYWMTNNTFDLVHNPWFRVFGYILLLVNINMMAYVWFAENWFEPTMYMSILTTYLIEYELARDLGYYLILSMTVVSQCLLCLKVAMDS